MAGISSISSSSYANALSTKSSSTYKKVDPATYEGTWTGTYKNKAKFSISIFNVSGFRARVKYQSGSTLQCQNVLIKDSSFRIGDTKFTLSSPGSAEVKTVITDPATGGLTLFTSPATKIT